MKHEILLGITRSDWRNKIGELKELEVRRIALFPPFELVERMSLYEQLNSFDRLEIVHVHLVDNMEQWELDFFKRHGAIAYNIHEEFAGLDLFQRNKKAICLENRFRGFPLELARDFGGVCVDFAHLELARSVCPELEPLLDMPADLSIGCAHVSAVPATQGGLQSLIAGERDEHTLHDLDEVDYLLNYRDIMPRILSLEINNPLLVQMQVRDYLHKILN